jgi:hypothetical protein
MMDMAVGSVVTGESQPESVPLTRVQGSVGLNEEEVEPKIYSFVLLGIEELSDQRGRRPAV